MFPNGKIQQKIKKEYETWDTENATSLIYEHTQITIQIKEKHIYLKIAVKI